MKTFIDTANRTWSVSVNVEAIRRVKSLLGVNLMDTLEGKLLDRLQQDPILLVDVLYVVCKEEADAKGVSDSDFGKAMGGDVLDRAVDAFMEELIDFFPSQRRALIRKARKTYLMLQDQSAAKAMEMLEAPTIQKRFDEAVRGYTDSVGSSPASSESTPALTPSAS